jgi:hypothetical protein
LSVFGRHDEATFDLAIGDVYVFCTDGVRGADTRAGNSATSACWTWWRRTAEDVARSHRRDPGRSRVPQRRPCTMITTAVVLRITA